MNKKILISLFSFLAISCSVSTMQGQVTIGSNIDPVEGALLDAKETAVYPGANSTKGVMYPRVELTDKTKLLPMITSETQGNRDAHTGLIVYNVTSDGTFTPGLHIWSGTEWQRLTATTVAASSIESLTGNAMSMSPRVFSFVGTTPQPYDGLITIPYVNGNGGFYNASDIAANCSDPGLTLTPYGGQLAYGPGAIYLKMTGTPTTVTKVGESVTINVLDFLGKSTTGQVGADQIVKTIPYVRKTVAIGNTNGIVPDSEVTIGNLEVRYIYASQAGTDGKLSYIQFRPKFNTHASFWFEKMGTGNIGKGMLYTYETLLNLNSTDWRDFTGGTGYSSSGKELNPSTRDQGRATITFQNNTKREAYRITCNAYTTIDANAVGAVTLFVEWLE